MVLVMVLVPQATTPRAAYPLELLLLGGGVGGGAAADGAGAAAGGQLVRRLDSKRLLEVAEDATKEAEARDKAKVGQWARGEGEGDAEGRVRWWL